LFTPEEHSYFRIEIGLSAGISRDLFPAWKRDFSPSPKRSRGAVNPIHLPVQELVLIVSLPLAAEVAEA
jgi:hypothetical protein